MMNRRTWLCREGFGITNVARSHLWLLLASFAEKPSFTAVFLLCSSLNWVTPEMLGVPFPDKKTAASGDPFLPAITGEFQCGMTFYHHHYHRLTSLTPLKCVKCVHDLLYSL